MSTTGTAQGEPNRFRRDGALLHDAEMKRLG